MKVAKFLIGQTVWYCISEVKLHANITKSGKIWRMFTVGECGSSRQKLHNYDVNSDAYYIAYHTENKSINP